MGLGPGPGHKAGMGFGISVPYNSPPLIHTRLPRGIKELPRPFDLGSLLAWSYNRYFLLMFISKDAPFRGARRSRHYCLTAREPKRRADGLRLASAGSLVNCAHLLLD